MSGDVDVNTSFAGVLVDEFVRCGVRYAVVAPGSRNTPLALALARADHITVDVVIDERSAAFRALGMGLATGRPAIVCCTSGTAAANFHPAVLEAHHANVPLLVCTADRPPELRGWGAGQTIDQLNLYGGAVRWFHDPGPPQASADAPRQWRALACRAVAEALGAPSGPVHLNLPFREPLVPTGEPLLDAPGRPDGAPWTTVTRVEAVLDPAALIELVRAHRRGLVVVGWGSGCTPATVARFAAAAGWPLLADPVSSCRTGDAISTYEALVRVERFTAAHEPEFVLRIGAPVTSKVTNQWLAAVPHALVGAAATGVDPDRTAAYAFDGAVEPLLAAAADALGALPATAWSSAWHDAERRTRAAIDAVLDAQDALVEGRIARDLAAAIPDGGTLLVGSSLPVRALEWCMAPRNALRVRANRGVNGIDGFVSTAAGIASASQGAPTVALCGDLCFLHDTNGLLGASVTSPLTYVVIDNDGGGIFSYLPQRDLHEFETLFGTPHGLDLVEVARAHGVAAERVEDKADWQALLAARVPVVVVPVDRATSVVRHRELWDAAATVLGG